MVAEYKRVRKACERFREPALSALLLLQLTMLFVLTPLFAMGFRLPLLLVPPVALVLILVLASHRPAALIIMVIAAGARALAGLLRILQATSESEAVDSASTVVMLLTVIWVISGVVFGAGRITSHRVRGAVVLYLTIAMAFAWFSRLIAELVPTAFSGLKFHPGGVFEMEPFYYFSLTALTTLGFGDITPVNSLARSSTTLEAVIGQLFPAIILARLLTLYSEDKKQER